MVDCGPAFLKKEWEGGSYKGLTTIMFNMDMKLCNGCMIWVGLPLQPSCICLNCVTETHIVGITGVGL